MDVKSEILLSAQAALRRELDVTANNIANIDTPGFKREAPVFRSYVEKLKDAPVPATGARVVNYVLDYGTTHDTSEGPFKPTGNPFDLMIRGSGYFGVRTPDGSTAYTRNGHFELNSNGVLVDSAGREVLSATSQPIQIDPNERAAVSVTPNGAVEGRQGEISRIAVFQFSDDAFAEQRGDGLFSGTRPPAAAPASAVTLKVGGLEESNVSGIAETARLIEIQRRYEASTNMRESLNDMKKSAINRLGHAE